MKNSRFKIQNLLLVLIFLLGTTFAAAQSTNQSFPTAVSSNEISGQIKARDIGDARLTTYFYTFNAAQGDMFVNVVTKNLDGDIDIFTASGLRPLTKIRVYSDASENETGRVIYLRQPERLILRIEGRTPDDNPATFRIKFAGSFEPLQAVAETEESKLPEVNAADEGEVQVNSVGTIIAVKPKPTPQPKEKRIVADTETKAESKPKIDKKVDENFEAEKAAAEKQDEKNDEEIAEEKKTEPKPVVVVTDNLKKDEKVVEKTEEAKKAEKEETETTSKSTAKPKKKTTKAEKPTEPNPLENIRLIVLFKDGTKIERPMSEVLRVNVDKGILTIISKDGTTGKYSILDVAKMTIE